MSSPGSTRAEPQAAGRAGAPPTAGPEAAATLLHRLAFPTAGTALIGASETITGSRLNARIDRLEATFHEHPEVRRLGLVISDTETLLPALAVGARRSLRLLLIRPELEAGTEWDVDAWLRAGDELELVPGPSRAPPDAAEIVLTSSGTTGRPKAALHPLSRLLGRIAPPRELPGAGPDAGRWLLTYHPASFAGIQVILSALVAGMPLIVAAEGRMADLTSLALAHAPTHVSGTPTFWRTFLAALGTRAGDLPLRAVTLGGEAADQATLDLVRARFPDARITHIYASTEAGALFAVKDGRAGFPAAWLESGIEGARLRIEDGVLLVQSPRAMARYLDRPGPGTEGWLNTGDLVALEGDRVVFRGRTDAVINVGGAKVIPDEVEAILLGLPFIQDVRVFGRRNPITGTLVAAEVVLDPEGADAAGAPDGPETRQTWARERIAAHVKATLAPHQIPRLISFASAIEVGASGKKVRA